MSTTELEPLTKLQKDVRSMAAELGAEQARGLVDLYYGLQTFRIQAGNQNVQLTKADEPHATVAFFHEQFHQLEKDIAKALDTYSAAQPLGEWARLHVGVGPVIAAGLLAHIPIEKTPTPSALWKFAGLSPGQKYVKGEKRSWNARLKVLCWKLGDSFVKQSGREKCYYGHVYRQRKEKEVLRNEAVRHYVTAERLGPEAVELGSHGWFVGGNAQAAARSLQEKNVRDPELRKTLLSGKLPDGQLEMRARRYAVKRFLVDYWRAAYILHFHSEPPRAYVFDQLNHVDVEENPYVSLPPL